MHTGLKQKDTVSICHHIPGRIRISVLNIKGDSLKTQYLRGCLAGNEGIEKVDINPRTCRALIIYDPAYQSADSIRTLITSINGNTKDKDIAEACACSDYPLVQKAGDLNMRQEKIRRLWYEMGADEVIEALGSNIDTGLSSLESRYRLQRYGLNTFSDYRPPSILKLLLQQFNIMTKLLLGAGAISFLLGNIADAVSILLIVLLEALVGVVQEYRAEGSLQKLKELASPEAAVIRDADILRISARELVPGDIIMLEVGNRVPADCRLLTDSTLEVKEDILTGESLPVAKKSRVDLQGTVSLAEQNNMVFMGTMVTRGRARAVVTATGEETEMGKIAALIQDAEEHCTPLQKQLNQLGRNLSLRCIGVSAAITLIGIISGQSIINMLRTGVSLAVGAIPEGLPAVVTISMAFGVQRMVKRNAVVRTLPAVETIAYTTVICSDKTGTLTANEMTVDSIYVNGDIYDVSGKGYQPFGAFRLDGASIEPHNNTILMKTLLGGILCNDSDVQLNEESGCWQVQGDPTEAALLVAGMKAGLSRGKTNNTYKRIADIPFDPAKRLMAVITEDKEKQLWLIVKGAPDEILERCDNQYINDNMDITLSGNIKEKARNACEQMTGSSLRAIAVACKKLSRDDFEQDEERLLGKLSLTGIVGMVDPPRPDVIQAIQRCQRAGIRVIMITGDHKNTAVSIALQLNILDKNALVLSGDEVEKMKERELEKDLERIQVIYRAAPGQKLQVVKAFKRKGYLVVMTGDGINDAPAVKEADIGIAMGRMGTDVTREAASITLTDDSFATIVAAIEEGRTIKDNIRKFIRYVLAGNLGEIIAVSSAAILKVPIPLEPGHILWVNLLTEGIPALALGMDPPHPGIMNKPPEKPNKQLFDRELAGSIVSRGFGIGASTMGAFAGSLLISPGDLPRAKTVAFSNLVICQLINAFDCREKYSCNESETENKYLLPAILVSGGLLTAAIYIPWLSYLLRTIPLRLPDWLIVMINSGIISRTASLNIAFNKKTSECNAIAQEIPISNDEIMELHIPDTGVSG